MPMTWPAPAWRHCGAVQRSAYHASDDSDMKMGDYFDLAADLYGLPRPPRLPRSTAQAALPLTLLSFMGESRRLDNTRLRRELRLRLHYPRWRRAALLINKVPCHPPRRQVPSGPGRRPGPARG